MAMYLCCFRQLCGTAPHPTVPTRITPTIILDTGYMGHEVVIVKNGVRICGTGGALGNIPILQNKAYFEVKLQQSDGAVRHNGEEKYKIADIPQEGDILGVSYDHVELNFYINGKATNTPVTSFKGTVYPALYVDDGAIMGVTFENFSYGPPPGYDSIMVEKSLLEND